MEALGKLKQTQYALIMTLKDSEETGGKLEVEVKRQRRYLGYILESRKVAEKNNHHSGNSGILDEADSCGGVCPSCGGHICAPGLEMALLPDPWQAQWRSMPMDAGRGVVRRVDIDQCVFL